MCDTIIMSIYVLCVFTPHFLNIVLSPAVTVAFCAVQVNELPHVLISTAPSDFETKLTCSPRYGLLLHLSSRTSFKRSKTFVRRKNKRNRVCHFSPLGFDKTEKCSCQTDHSCVGLQLFVSINKEICIYIYATHILYWKWE